MRIVLLFSFFHIISSFVKYSVNKPKFIYCSQSDETDIFYRKYPLSRKYYEMRLRRLNSKNHTIQNNEINKEFY